MSKKVAQKHIYRFNSRQPLLMAMQRIDDENIITFDSCCVGNIIEYSLGFTRKFNIGDFPFVGIAKLNNYNSKTTNCDIQVFNCFTRFVNQVDVPRSRLTHDSKVYEKAFKSLLRKNH